MADDGSQSPQTAERDNFAMIPRIAEKDLDPFEYRLFGHYSQVCGQDGGRCWQGSKTIHETTGLSIGKITRVRNSLAVKGYIRVDTPDGKSRNRGEGISVSLVDLWQENRERCQGEKTPDNEPSIPPAEGLCEEPCITSCEEPCITLYKETESANARILATNKKREEESLKEEKTTNSELPANQESVAGMFGDVVVFNLTEADLWENATDSEPGSEEYQPVEAKAVLPSKPKKVAYELQIAPPQIPAKPLPKARDSMRDNPLGRILDALEDEWKRSLTRTDGDNAQSALDEFGEDWTTEAIKESAFKKKKFWGYASSILNNWQSDGHKSTTYDQKAKSYSQEVPEDDGFRYPPDMKFTAPTKVLRETGVPA